jgi:hypothetical protein
LIIWQAEETYKANFSDRAEVIRVAKDLVRRGAVLCASCHGQLKFHGCYRRYLKDEESNRERGWVAQVHCGACGAYPALIPGFIMPYKHYSAEVIECVIAESENGENVEKLGGCAADVSTMRRWVRQFTERGARAAGWLLSILLKLYERQISLLELRNKTILKQLARLLREFPTLKTGGVIGRANTVLTTQNCGFL